MVELAGDLDLVSSAEADRRIRDQERRGAAVLIVDLRRLRFLDSTGLRLLMTTDARLRRRGRRLVLVRGQEAVQRVFRITKLDRELEFVDDPSERAGRA